MPNIFPQIHKRYNCILYFIARHRKYSQSADRKAVLLHPAFPAYAARMSHCFRWLLYFLFPFLSWYKIVLTFYTMAREGSYIFRENTSDSLSSGIPLESVVQLVYLYFNKTTCISLDIKMPCDLSRY